MKDMWPNTVREIYRVRPNNNKQQEKPKERVMGHTLHQQILIHAFRGDLFELFHPRPLSRYAV